MNRPLEIAASAGDFRVMSLVGFAHATSHFFHLVIPSLFPWLMADFGLSFTRAGTLTTAFFVISGIAAMAGWRNAALAAAALGLLALTSVVLLRGSLGAPAPAHARVAGDDGPRSSPFAFLRVSAVWMCFFFFLASIVGFGALQNFAPSVLSHVYGLPLTAAASALTLYLLGGAAGILAGGFLAARYAAHERVVAVLLVT